MFRYALAVIVGYIALAAIVMLGFVPGFVQRDLAMQPGSLDVKPGWIVYTLVISFVASVAGGWVCAIIARSQRVVVAFAVLAFLVGIIMAMQNYQKPKPTLTAEQIEAMSYAELGEAARQPNWYAFMLPFVAATGIVAGGRLQR